MSEPAYESYYAPTTESQDETVFMTSVELCESLAEVAARDIYFEVYAQHELSFPTYAPTGYLFGEKLYRITQDSAERSAELAAFDKWDSEKQACMVEQGFQISSICVSNCSL